MKEMFHLHFKHPRLAAPRSYISSHFDGWDCRLFSDKSRSNYAIKNNQVALSDSQIKKNLDTKIITTRQDSQKAATAKYKAPRSSKYTLTSPYVKVNPYGTSPLSALVTFKTSNNVKVTYTVVGKTDKTSITNTVKGGYTTSHQVPVVGLYADTTNTVKITATTKAGKTQTRR